MIDITLATAAIVNWNIATADLINRYCNPLLEIVSRTPIRCQSSYISLATVLNYSQTLGHSAAVFSLGVNHSTD